MKRETLHELFEIALYTKEEELKRYAEYFCAESGYSVNDFALRCETKALLPEIHASFRPTLNYDARDLFQLTTELEDDLNNIVFEHAYNMHFRIGAENARTIEHLPLFCESLQQLSIVRQN